MAIRPIRKLGDPVLKSKSLPVSKIDEGVKNLIKDMGDTMHQAPGVGLAAPQVGVNKQVIVIDVGEGLQALINPTILEKKGEQEGAEGCLSVPGVERLIFRAEFIEVKFLDENGQERIEEFEGFSARVIQHEVDHLHGELIVNKGKPVPVEEQRE